MSIARYTIPQAPEPSTSLTRYRLATTVGAPSPASPISRVGPNEKPLAYGSPGAAQGSEVDGSSQTFAFWAIYEVLAALEREPCVREPLMLPAQPRHPLLRIPNDRLQLRIRILPQRDQLLVVGPRLRAIALRLEELAQALVASG